MNKFNKQKIVKTVTTFSIFALLLFLIVSPANLGVLNYAQADNTGTKVPTPTKDGSQNIQGSPGLGQIAVTEGKSANTPGGQVEYMGIVDITKPSASTATKNTGKTL